MDGTPVAGAVVQFCSESLCMTGNTDENGEAHFDQEAGVYTVHVLRLLKVINRTRKSILLPGSPEM